VGNDRAIKPNTRAAVGQGVASVSNGSQVAKRVSRPLRLPVAFACVRSAPENAPARDDTGSNRQALW
jgi:hypothetical protein